MGDQNRAQSQYKAKYPMCLTCSICPSGTSHRRSYQLAASLSNPVETHHQQVKNRATVHQLLLYAEMRKPMHDCDRWVQAGDHERQRVCHALPPHRRHHPCHDGGVAGTSGHGATTDIRTIEPEKARELSKHLKMEIEASPDEWAPGKWVICEAYNDTPTLESPKRLSKTGCYMTVRYNAFRYIDARNGEVLKEWKRAGSVDYQIHRPTLKLGK